MANHIVILDENRIKSKILAIRGQQVILDRDLAELYEVKTGRLNEQVKRNIERFPGDFMFQLTEKERDELIANCDNLSVLKFGPKLPYVFTEQGVANLSGVLSSKKAVEVNIHIMRAFVAMRRFIASNAQVFYRLDKVEKKQIEHGRKFEQVFDAIQSKGIKPEKGIFFEGQVFDAYRFVSDVIRSAQSSIILIDNFVDDTVLTLFCKRRKNVHVTIFTSKVSRQLSLDLAKYNSQYPPIELKEFRHSHDRFLIIDKKEVYHLGASLKDLGKKWFAFSRMDKGALRMLDKLSILSS
jgi:hypothetical protein